MQPLSSATMCCFSDTSAKFFQFFSPLMMRCDVPLATTETVDPKTPVRHSHRKEIHAHFDAPHTPPPLITSLTSNVAS